MHLKLEKATVIFHVHHCITTDEGVLMWSVPGYYGDGAFLLGQANPWGYLKTLHCTYLSSLWRNVDLMGYNTEATLMLWWGSTLIYSAFILFFGNIELVFLFGFFEWGISTSSPSPPHFYFHKEKPKFPRACFLALCKPSLVDLAISQCDPSFMYLCFTQVTELATAKSTVFILC